MLILLQPAGADARKRGMAIKGADSFCKKWRREVMSNSFLMGFGNSETGLNIYNVFVR
jgi:hypothetical protein